MQQNSVMRAVGGRAASRERRAQLVQGKSGLPPAAERTRGGESKASIPAAIATTSASSALKMEMPTVVPPQVAPGRGAPLSRHTHITGTLFSGDENGDAGGTGVGNCVTGDTPRNVERVTGTQRGAERRITGMSYYCAHGEDKMTATNTIERVANAFSVRSPQNEAQLRADDSTTRLPSAEGRITGTFARGEGKITGNQEFHFSPHARSEDGGGRSHVTGEGGMEGRKITGGAWDIKSNVTSTEDYHAAERNPSTRAGQSHTFANASLFKGKGNHAAPTQHVTGMVGWSAKTAARVTLSGGAQG